MKKTMILTLTAAFFIITGAVFGRTIMVPSEYATIQQAVDAANHGDTVIVAPGRYPENVNFNGRNIVLTSTNPQDPDIVANTIIDASGSGSVVTFANGEGPDAVLVGFTITGGIGTVPDEWTYYGAGVYCYQASPTITRNVITGNHTRKGENFRGYGGGICCRDASATITRNIIKGNSAYYGGGIMVWEGKDTIAGNLICENSAERRGGGVRLRYGGRLINNTLVANSSCYDCGTVSAASNPTNGQCQVLNNIICNARRGAGIWFSSWPEELRVMAYNNVWNNIGGNYIDWPDQTGINGNISADPMFFNPDADNYHLKAASPCINAGDPDFVSEPDEMDIDGDLRVFAGRVDMGADERVGYINPVADTGPDQYPDEIQLVTLDGSGSYFDDPNGIKEFAWTQIAGPVVVLSDSAAVQPTFMPTSEAEYIFELLVSDGLNVSRPDQVLILVGNRPPVADAGPGGFHHCGGSITLDGSGSYDPDPVDELTYHWTQLAGPNVVLLDTDTATPYFDCNQDGFYLFELIVDDGFDQSEPSQVEIKAITVTIEQQNLDFTIQEKNRWGDVSGTRVVFTHGAASPGGWDIECKDLQTGQVFNFVGERIDTHPRIDGDIVVWFGSHTGTPHKIYATNIITGFQTTLRRSTSRSYVHPAISGNKVVWVEHFDFGQIDPEEDESPFSICGADITDLENPTFFTVAENVGTGVPIICYGCFEGESDDRIDICGNIVVWEAQGDIYGADISDLNDIEVFAICTDQAPQSDPAVSGNIVVWTDERNDYGDIYGADIADRENIQVFEIVTEEFSQTQPAIDGPIIVYTTSTYEFWGTKACCLTRDHGVFDIELADSYGGEAPAIDGEWIVWQQYIIPITVEAAGVSLEVVYSIADGPVENLTTGKTYDYIQHAINDANAGDEIVVSEGVYHENIDFKGKNLIVRSTDPNDRGIVENTVINGDGRGAASTFSNGENKNCVFAGFTITSGNNGIYCSGVCATITNCNIVENGGAGIEAQGALGRSSPTIVNCTIAGNKGHGIYARGSKTPTVRNCIVVGNKGVGIDADERPAITNCTIVGNELSGISAYRATVTNSIIWGNWPQQIVDDYNNCSVTYSNVQSGWPGDGNTDIDPCFADADGPDNAIGTKDDNLRLTPGSPCIDIGNNEADTDLWIPGIQPLPDTDFDGRPRIIDGDCNDTDVVDMGAYEFYFAAIGDFDSDCDVDFEDFAILGSAWLTEPGDDSWNLHCDINVPADSRIDWRDLSVLIDNWLAVK